MASSAFGFARAVETLPNYFEFGKSLVGQGKDDLDRAAKEKAYAQDLGLRASEQALRDEMDRRQMDYRYADLERQRQYDKDQLDLRRQQFGLEERKFNEVDKPKTAADIQNTNSVVGARNAMLPHNIAQTQAETGQINANTRQLNTEAKAAEYNQKQREEQDAFENAFRLYLDNPFNPNLDENTKRELQTHIGLLSNPNAGNAYNTVAEVMQSGAAPTPEQIDIVGSALQPLIDQGGPGQKFLGFEPSEDHKGVRIRLRNANGEDVYMTKGRRPVSQGDTPDIFSMAEIGQVMGHIRDIASWQDTHPEARQELADMAEARRFSSSPKEYRRIVHERQIERIRQAQGEDKARQHDADAMVRRSDKIIKDLGKMYDEQVIGDTTLLPEEEQSKAFAAKNAFLSQARQRLNGATRDDLMELDAPDIFNAMGPISGQRSAAPSRGGQFHSPVVNR